MPATSTTKPTNARKVSSATSPDADAAAEEAMLKLYGQPLDDAGILNLFRAHEQDAEAQQQIERIRQAGRAFAHVIAANTRRTDAQRDAIRAVLHATLIAEQAVRSTG